MFTVAALKPTFLVVGFAARIARALLVGPFRRRLYALYQSEAARP
jgi:hypothetical protein